MERREPGGCELPQRRGLFLDSETAEQDARAFRVIRDKLVAEEAGVWEHEEALT